MSIREALQDPNYLAAMKDDHEALLWNKTWTLVPRPHGTGVISGKWLFHQKLKPDGALGRYKERWIVWGFTQCLGLNLNNTSAQVVKPGTIHTVLHLTTSCQWHVHQLDVSNAFLHGILFQRVHYQQLAGFVDVDHLDYICLLTKSLYGLKQTSHAWYQLFVAFITKLGFVSTRFDSSLFVLHHDNDMAYFLLYADDIVLIASLDQFL